MQKASTILLTGTTGFIGVEISRALAAHPSMLVRLAVRNLNSCTHDNTMCHEVVVNNVVAVGSISGLTDWSLALSDITVVIHAAARAHIMRDAVSDPLAEYRLVNVEGTLNLARQAAAAGVKRFVFISSVKVNGESTVGAPAFSEQDEPAPQDAYGISKMEAEYGLRSIAEQSGMEVVIIRLPLVYGPRVKANFLSLMKLAYTPLPLPFSAIHNARSMIYVGNAVDFIIKCVEHPLAKNKVFMISDRHDLSLPELLTLIRKAMGKSPRLLPMSRFLLQWLGAVTGKRVLMDKLLGSLQVNSSKAVDLLDWKPPYTVEQGIKVTVDSFLQDNK